jgi:anti-anti-sigma factor
MRPDQITPAPHEASRPLVQIELRPPVAPDFHALVRLHGEHDLATSPLIENALASVEGHILMDLSGCTFIDSSVIGTIVRRVEELEPAGFRLELLVPPENESVSRTLDLSGMRSTIPTRESLG